MDEPDVVRLRRIAWLVLGIELAALLAAVGVWPSVLLTVAGLAVWFATVGWFGRRIRDLVEGKRS